MTAISPQWQAKLDLVGSRKSSPLLMPVALATLIRLADEGKVRDGRVEWRAFEEAFGSVMESHDPSKKAQAWSPFYYLSGRVGLWTLWRQDKPADFADLRKSKPTSAASLKARIDHAQLLPELLSDLAGKETRGHLSQAITELLR